MIKNLIKVSLKLLIVFTFSANAQVSNINNDSLQSIELNRNAIVLSRQGLYTQALPMFYKSLSLRRKIYGDFDPKLAAVYLNIGITYKNLGNLDLALKNYYLAEKCYENPNLNLYINIGSVYRSKLDFVNALKYYNQALAIAKSNKKNSLNVIAAINYNIAEIYYLSNNFDYVIQIAQENIRNASIEDQIRYYSLLAFVYQVTNEKDKATFCYQKNIDLTKRYYGNSNGEVIISILDYSSFLITNKQFSEAKKNLDRALEIIQSSDIQNKQLLSDYYKWSGYWWENLIVATENISMFKKQKMRNLQEALILYEKSLRELDFAFDINNDSTLGLSNQSTLLSSMAVLKLLADVYNEMDDLEKSTDQTALTVSLKNAIETYEIIGKLIQKARREITNDESKIELTKLEYETFNKIIQTSFLAYQATNNFKYFELAFQNAERLKSSSLYDKISNQLAAQNSLIPDSLLELEFILNNEIAFYHEKLIAEKSNILPDSLKILDYNNQIFAASRQRDELNRILETEYTDFVELKYSRSLLTADEISGKLKDNRMLVEYYLSETDSVTELYSFIIGSNKLLFNKQTLDSDFHRDIENVFRFISNSDFLQTTRKESNLYCLSSFNLYKTLIQPIENELKDKNITIVADGKLCYIPFDALLSSLPDTTKSIEFNKLDYLIKYFTFNYANSSNLLFGSKPSNKRTRIKTGAFAPVYSGFEIIENAGQNILLFQIPGTQKEVTKIARMGNTELFIGEKATEENFREKAGKFDILHLAMHAFINDSIPALSSFAFTQLKNADITKNGLLNTADIYNLRLNAALTVLSACNTGSGKLKKGEGIMSLARGFLYAGCPSLIISLWEVEDNSGTEIITSFYKHLKRGKAKDEALRAAKLEYLDSVNSRMAHPHYWLGFISLGDESALFMSYDFYFFILLTLALAGIGIDQIIRIKKARKKQAQ